MNSLPLFFAQRYIMGGNKSTTIKSMLIVCFLGIFIGSCSLALVAFVMEGIEKKTHEKLQGINPEIIIRSYTDQALDVDRIQHVIAQEFHQVSAIAPQAQSYALVQPHDETYAMVLVKGIDPQQEPFVTTLAHNIVHCDNNTQQKVSLETLLVNNNVLIGESLATTHGIVLGDIVSLLIPESSPTRAKNLRFEESMVRVNGIFKTGIDEFDANVIYCALPFFAALFPDSGITSLGLKIAPHHNQEKTVTALRSRLNLSVLSWKELYPALIASMTLEKYAMFFILALITLVASMSMVSLLYMLIVQKRSDIALLKSMGVSATNISRIFIIIGLLIAFTACALGLVLATIFAYILDTYQLIALPDVYYVSHLPATINFYTIAVVFGAVMFISFLASWLPARATRTINISQVLRFEG